MNIIYNLLVRMRMLFLRYFYNNILIGVGSVIDLKSRLWVVGKGAKIVLGDNCYIRSREYCYHAGMAFPCTLYAAGGRINVGDSCRLNGVFINSEKEVQIGSNCVIASGVQIMDSNGHVVHSLNRTIGRDNPKRIVIGDNCWIGLNLVILKGTILGNNCIVGAGSVVSGVFPDNVILRGNPAEIVDFVRL